VYIDLEGLRFNKIPISLNSGKFRLPFFSYELGKRKARLASGFMVNCIRVAKLLSAPKVKIMPVKPI
jgi:hypothetical protein